MSDAKLLVGPFNRVEGDLEIRLELSGGRVARAEANSPLFRGFERILLGKRPEDALTITPRICGICSISQSMAAALALADLAGARMPPEAMRAAAILHGVENLCDHLTHFYLFFMPDFARAGYAGREWHGQMAERFTAAEGSGLRAAVEARARLFHIVGLLGGKWPHTLAIQPGGVTRAPTRRDRIRMQADLRQSRAFLERALFGAPLEAFAALETPAQYAGWETGDAGLFLRAAADLDLSALGRGPGRFLSWGAYPLPGGRAWAAGLWDGTARAADPGLVAEDLSHAWMLGATAHPMTGETLPDEEMRETAYSWCKAPRYGGQAVETGALARQAVAGHPLARALAAEPGVTARIGGRLLEIARLQILLEEQVAALRPEARFMDRVALPAEGEGQGLVEAARGALGHWIRVEKGRIAGYQIIAPTTWNFSPRDSDGTPGPVEAALVGAPVAEGEEVPLAVQHVVRSFDPCMNCTVH
ncbi:nickel-dependent hydrogenase large subunit [Poseidonocella sp. HB161398]|uniref:nickel-dependent hydrogenase large subunit n=1 Tax=Poseidonocella sp. HB161398 TaxID=2320855 RepID=UPI001109879E|nr:nickel-dependent hydrogenase large subunit [Poseidonocella sp. HB161398]